MKAAQIEQHGGPEVIKINEVDKPEPANDQILVAVRAAALNPFDLFVIKGPMDVKFPYTVGGDFAGVVAEVGGGVEAFKAGDEVYGQGYNLGSGSGAVAQFITLKADKVAAKPKNVNFEEAAALVLVGVSAMQALDQLELKPGQKILIQGGAGGIGSVAIQYAKHLGAYVAATARSADEKFVKELGADQFIDFENQPVEDILKDYDAVFDTVRGGGVTEATFKVVKRGGKIISMSSKPDAELSTKYGVTDLYQSSQTDQQSLTKLAKLIEHGVMTPHIDKTFSLDQAVEAYQYLATGHPRGKVVIKVD